MERMPRPPSSPTSLSYRPMELTPGTPPTALWFEGDDGTQIHLSEDPDHHPSTRAHVARELGDSLGGRVGGKT